jgi:hypothetical protein
VQEAWKLRQPASSKPPRLWKCCLWISLASSGPPAFFFTYHASDFDARGASTSYASLRTVRRASGLETVRPSAGIQHKSRDREGGVAFLKSGAPGMTRTRDSCTRKPSEARD